MTIPVPRDGNPPPGDQDLVTKATDNLRRERSHMLEKWCVERQSATRREPASKRGCPTRLFLPNERAQEPQIAAVYRRFGLNERQIEILARATPKRDYYCQSRRGNRLFDLGLGDIALAFSAASSKQDQAEISRLLTAAGATDFAEAWLRHRGLDWALGVDLTTLEAQR